MSSLALSPIGNAARRVVALSFFIALGLLLGSFPTLADASSGPSPSGPVEPWTIDDLLLAERIGEMLLSPDGDMAIWTRTGWQSLGDGEEGPAEKRNVSHIFMARFSGDGPVTPVQLTRDAHGASGLALSPDGRHLAFLAKREQPGKKELESPQVWVLPLSGGEAWPISAEKNGVQAAYWIDDKKLLIQRTEDASAFAQRREKIKDTSNAVEDLNENPPVRLFVTDLKGESRRLTDNAGWVQQVAVAPDGQRAAVTIGQSLSFAFDAKKPPRTYLLDVASGALTEILQGQNLQPHSFEWAADSKSFFFIDNRANNTIYRNATVAELHRFDLESGNAAKLDFDWPRGLGRGYSLVEGGAVMLLADGARFQPARLDATAGALSPLGGQHSDHLDRLVGSRDGSRVLYITSSGDRSPQVFTATLGGNQLNDEKRLGMLNAAYQKRPSGRTEIVRWQGAEGDEVEGVLSYPFGYEEGKTYALILDIHGGPTGFDRDSWDANWASPSPLWRQRGAFVFRVNYHGSGNYGLEWAESIKERYYELEIPDIESGVDMLIERGLVDADRMATSGWSNGGILSAGLITHTDRYKAAIIGAADIEWISDWANVDFGAAFDNYYFGGPPWERLDHYIEKSPFFKLPEVTTPSLVHTGTEDRNVPPHQSWSIFRVMQQVGKADVRLLLYPGEPHGLRKIEHQRRKVEEDLAWFDRYLFETHLFETYQAKSFAVPQGSPLEAALMKAEAARQPAGFGLERQGHLVPEGVPYAGLVVSRFEITAAQWSAYLKAAAGEGRAKAPHPRSRYADLPITNVGFEAAQAYAAWVSEITGEKWRLPTVAEATRLASEGGNTLDAWLGYAANPDDAQNARKRIRDAGLELVKKVGSHAGSRSPGMQTGPAVFDLDGNVAEWAIGKDGQGVPVGPSAERTSKSKAAPEPAFIGVRLVQDPS